MKQPEYLHITIGLNPPKHLLIAIKLLIYFHAKLLLIWLQNLNNLQEVVLIVTILKWIKFIYVNDLKCVIQCTCFLPLVIGDEEVGYSQHLLEILVFDEIFVIINQIFTILQVYLNLDLIKLILIIFFICCIFLRLFCFPIILYGDSCEILEKICEAVRFVLVGLANVIKIVINPVEVGINVATVAI